MEDHVAFLITVPTALAIFFAIFILVCLEPVFKKLLRIFSLVVWVCLVAMGYLFMCFGGIICPWDQVRLLLLLILFLLAGFPRSILSKSVNINFCGTSHEKFLWPSVFVLRFPASVSSGIKKCIYLRVLLLYFMLLWKTNIWFQSPTSFCSEHLIPVTN